MSAARATGGGSEYRQGGIVSVPRQAGDKRNATDARVQRDGEVERLRRQKEDARALGMQAGDEVLMMEEEGEEGGGAHTPHPQVSKESTAAAEEESGAARMSSMSVQEQSQKVHWLKGSVPEHARKLINATEATQQLQEHLVDWTDPGREDGIIDGS
jgi:hypothetical protein